MDNFNVALLLLLLGCGAGTSSTDVPAASDAGAVLDAGMPLEASSSDTSVYDGGVTPTPDATSSYWFPTPGTSWQWQISGTLDTSVDVKVYDVDLFNTTDDQITLLHAAGRKVVCYFDTAYEPARPDSAALEPYKGNAMKGWPGQYWIDIRQPAVVSVMKARTELAKTKHCDAVEGDDVDARSNDPGFPISDTDQQRFIRTLAMEAHARGMGYALKNDLQEIGALLGDVDFALDEECFQFGECALLNSFIAAGKAVFEVEYTPDDLATKGATVCPEANALNFDTLIKHLDLGPPRYACR